MVTGPKVGRGIEKVFQRGGHVAETGRAAQCQSAAADQIFFSTKYCTVVWNAGCGAFGYRTDWWNRTNSRLNASHLINASGHMQREILRPLGSGVIQNQYIGGAHISSSTFSGGRPITALSPQTTMGRSSSMGFCDIA